MSAALWSGMPMGPPDAILGLTDAYNKDPDVRKVSLGVGAYRDDEGKPVVLETVREAERRLLAKNANHEYAGIAGIPGFVQHALRFAYGVDSVPLKEKRIAAVQTLSGTGACRVIGELFARFKGRGSAIYLPNPTWGNHIPIYADAGLEVKRYRYYDAATCGLDYAAGLIEDFENAPDNSVFLLHACAHNPTGVDPTMDQWKEISALMKRKDHTAFFDCAYQGFASGDAEKDAGAIRLFVSDGHRVALGQSFAKNFGLYGERVGALSVICVDAAEAARVESQLKLVIRPMYSNPPVYGARLVQEILGDEELSRRWAGECRAMADRIIQMRTQLRGELERLGSGRSWRHITDQIGMFCYTGLTRDEVAALQRDAHIYFTADGRISMAGLNSGNVSYVAESIFKVTA
ncbi:unnamed protein product [Phaeothamnion confervicola]